MEVEILKNKLNEFHKSKCDEIFGFRDDILEGGFHGDFNVSGFHKEVLKLAEEKNSFWGIDKCLRLEEKIDEFHTYLFDMGIFAKSINLNNSFLEPFKDRRFETFQREIINQFFEMIKSLGLNLRDLEATYFGGCTFGASNDGRNKLLKREYTFPLDVLSKKMLEEERIISFSVNSISNIDINPIDGALVGPRIEIFYKGVEIATIVFDCFRIKKDILIPINYVGGYAIGIERLLTLLNNKKSILESFENYKIIIQKVSINHPAINSSQFKSERFVIAYGLEAFSKLKNLCNISEGQKKKILILKKSLNESCSSVGIKETDLVSII